MKWQSKIKSLLIKEEAGVSLVEVLIAIVVLGVIIGPFLYGIATGFIADRTADTISTAQSLAQSQIEYIKRQQYNNNTTATYLKLDAADIPDGYAIKSINRSNATVTPIVAVPWDTGNNDTHQAPLDTPAANDTGIQKIRLVVENNNKVILTLETYKVNRQ